jgi:hypothetical protein
MLFYCGPWTHGSVVDGVFEQKARPMKDLTTETATDHGSDDGVEDGAADGLLGWKMLGRKAHSDDVFEGLDDGWGEGSSDRGFDDGVEDGCAANCD